MDLIDVLTIPQYVITGALSSDYTVKEAIDQRISPKKKSNTKVSTLESLINKESSVINITAKNANKDPFCCSVKLFKRTTLPTKL